jgi:ABC-type transport system substrate-binding protein
MAYRAIRSMDITDPKTAVVRFRSVTARWPEIFGGSRGFILKRSAFPRADPAHPNLRLKMKRAIPFSGGPWILRSWRRDGQAILVGNDRFWGTKSALRTVQFVHRAGWDEQIESLFIGEVAAAFPQPPWSMGTLESMPFNPHLHADGRNGILFEALWFNPSLRPLNDKAVREALMYAVDRQAIVDAFVKLNNPRAEVLNCGFVSLPDGPWCATRPFARFSHDPEKAREILETGGYDCSVRICRKNGKPLQIRYVTNDLSRFQTSIAQLVQAQAAEAGIELRPVHFDAGVLFGLACPFRGLAISQCALSAPSHGSLTDLLSCEARGSVGQPPVGWCNREADRLMRESDRELDQGRRLELLSRVHEMEAEVFMGLPLFVMPAVSAWRTDKVAGPIGRYSSTPYGMFFNMNEWYPPS